MTRDDLPADVVRDLDRLVVPCASKGFVDRIVAAAVAGAGSPRPARGPWRWRHLLGLSAAGVTGAAALAATLLPERPLRLSDVATALGATSPAPAQPTAQPAVPRPPTPSRPAARSKRETVSAAPPNEQALRRERIADRIERRLVRRGVDVDRRVLEERVERVQQRLATDPEFRERMRQRMIDRRERLRAWRERPEQWQREGAVEQPRPPPETITTD